MDQCRIVKLGKFVTEHESCTLEGGLSWMQGE